MTGVCPTPFFIEIHHYGNADQIKKGVFNNEYDKGTDFEGM